MAQPHPGPAPLQGQLRLVELPLRTPGESEEAKSPGLSQLLPAWEQCLPSLEGS